NYFAVFLVLATLFKQRLRSVDRRLRSQVTALVKHLLDSLNFPTDIFGAAGGVGSVSPSAGRASSASMPSSHHFPYYGDVYEFGTSRRIMRLPVDPHSHLDAAVPLEEAEEAKKDAEEAKIALARQILSDTWTQITHVRFHDDRARRTEIFLQALTTAVELLPVISEASTINASVAEKMATSASNDGVDENGDPQRSSFGSTVGAGRVTRNRASFAVGGGNTQTAVSQTGIVDLPILGTTVLTTALVPEVSSSVGASTSDGAPPSTSTADPSSTAGGMQARPLWAFKPGTHGRRELFLP
ncbi:unnamed protein product, partial [Amoebophrya sp. A25]